MIFIVIFLAYGADVAGVVLLVSKMSLRLSINRKGHGYTALGSVILAAGYEG